jgi:hypothetical protein
MHGYRLAIDYFGVVKDWSVSSPRFLGGFRAAVCYSQFGLFFEKSS